MHLWSNDIQLLLRDSSLVHFLLFEMCVFSRFWEIDWSKAVLAGCYRSSSIFFFFQNCFLFLCHRSNGFPCSRRSKRLSSAMQDRKAWQPHVICPSEGLWRHPLPWIDPPCTSTKAGEPHSFSHQSPSTHTLEAVWLTAAKKELVSSWTSKPANAMELLSLINPPRQRGDRKEC